MGRPPLDELYFTWLYSKVASVETTNPSRTYWVLMKKLFTKEFVWFVPNDDNRAEDGRGLRQEFLDEEGIVSVDADWHRLGCSMLELLIALSRRLEFEAGWTAKHWFWVLMENTSLDLYTDREKGKEHYVDEILQVIIWRTYMPSGHGGLFPLEHPNQDQRRVELWYQMCAWLIENDGR
jgi:hypothetical protein